MTRFEILNSAMIASMKNKDLNRRDAIRAVIAAVKKAAIDKRCEITDDLVDELLLKEIKIIKEQIDTCPAERAETLGSYKEKLAVIEEFAPRLMETSEEITSYINYIVANYDVDTSSTGAAMKTIMPHLKGKCDMKIASQLLRGMHF